MAYYKNNCKFKRKNAYLTQCRIEHYILKVQDEIDPK